MEAKVDDRTMDILSALRELKRMIAAESIRWYSAKNSSTADMIGHFEVALDVLIGFAQDQDAKSFIVALYHYRLSIVDIRKCFYATENVASCRNRANRLWHNLIQKMFSLLEKEKIKQMAHSVENFPLDLVRTYLQGESVESEKQEPVEEKLLSIFM